jgi:hypothetical protein
MLHQLNPKGQDQLIEKLLKLRSSGPDGDRTRTVHLTDALRTNPGPTLLPTQYYTKNPIHALYRSANFGIVSGLLVAGF